MSFAVWLERRRGFLTAWAVALVLGAAVVTIADLAYKHVPHPHPLEELSYYPSGRHLEPATLGHAETAADLAWLRAIQYYGEHRSTDNQFVKMEHVFDILTSLSPRFVPAYIFGGFSLAQEGRDFPAAERLMLKGIEANPRAGELAFQLGFLYYVKPGGRDLVRAAQFFEQAAHQPNPPLQADRFAAFCRQHSGNLVVALELWANIRRTSKNELLREVAEQEMQKIRLALSRGQRDIAVKHLTTPVVQFQ